MKQLMIPTLWSSILRALPRASHSRQQRRSTLFQVLRRTSKTESCLPESTAVPELRLLHYSTIAIKSLQFHLLTIDILLIRTLDSRVALCLAKGYLRSMIILEKRVFGRIPMM